MRLLMFCSVLVTACSSDEADGTAVTAEPALTAESGAAAATETPTAGVVEPGQVDDIVAAFGVERELAECINLELGDVANIDPSELTPDLLSRPVCGTSLLAILSGAPLGG